MPIVNYKSKNKKGLPNIEDVMGANGSLYNNTNYEYRELQYDMINNIQKGID